MYTASSPASRGATSKLASVDGVKSDGEDDFVDGDAGRIKFQRLKKEVQDLRLQVRGVKWWWAVDYWWDGCGWLDCSFRIGRINISQADMTACPDLLTNMLARVSIQASFKLSEDLLVRLFAYSRFRASLLDKFFLSFSYFFIYFSFYILFFAMVVL